MTKDAVIILSGGMDSVTLLHEYESEISLAVTFDYGANHSEQEIRCAKLNCIKLGIEHIIISLDFVKQHFTSSLLSGADAIPEGHYNDESMKSTVVPFRNGIMLSVACGIAESRGLKRVMLANHAGDHTIYPDCRASFIEAMTTSIWEGTWAHIGLTAPYTNISKTDIAKRGKDLGVDYGITWSCYKGLAKHCGKCGTCIERREALHEAGIVDTTEYED